MESVNRWDSIRGIPNQGEQTIMNKEGFVGEETTMTKEWSEKAGYIEGVRDEKNHG
jgi:hypothetical protein